MDKDNEKNNNSNNQNIIIEQKITKKETISSVNNQPINDETITYSQFEQLINKLESSIVTKVSSKLTTLVKSEMEDIHTQLEYVNLKLSKISKTDIEDKINGILYNFNQLKNEQLELFNKLHTDIIESKSSLLEVRSSNITLNNELKQVIELNSQIQIRFENMSEA